MLKLVSLFAGVLALIHGSGSLVRRTAQESCWVIENARATSICVPHALWIRWLSEREPPSWDGNPPGRWKLISDRRNTPALRTGEPKESRELFVASGLPNGKATSRIVVTIERWRERISEELAPSDSLHLFRAILLGERNRGDPGSVLALLGFVHLLSITGIHLYALARGCSTLILFAGEWVGAPTPLVLWGARVFATLAWLAAWLLAGAPAAMLRIWGVAAARVTAKYFGFRWRALVPLVLGLALGGSLFYGLSIGGAILAAGQGWFGLAFYAWIFAALAEIGSEHHVALLAPVINAVGFPLLIVLIYPVVFFLSFFHVPAFLLQLSNQILLFLAKLALGLDSFWIISKSALSIAALFAALAWITPKPYRRKMRFALLGLALLLRFVPTPHDVIQLDVGQGDSALVLGDKPGLIDTGSEKSLSDAEWIRVLSANDVNKLEFVALTHLDEDHSGGLKRLARLLPIRCAVTSLAEIESPRGSGYRAAIAPVPFADWSAPCVPFPTYAPEPARTGANQNMGAVFIPLPGLNYLSAGDADREEEKKIAAWARPLLAAHRADLVFKVSHHGSLTSSDESALKLLDPAVAVISVGRGNPYGHPAVETLLRLERLGIPFFRTDQWGALSATEALEVTRADGRRRR